MPKVIALVSGGIDSAVALGLALEQGLDVLGVYFKTTQESRGEKKTKELAGILDKKFGTKTAIYTVPFEKVLEEIVQKCDRKLACVLCKRTMERIAEKIALREGAQALLKGDSLGQVASQTLANMNAEAGNISMPIIRPLIGMDKLEIEAIAKRLQIYETASKKSPACPVPQKPATKARRAIVEAEEKKIALDRLIEEALKAGRKIS